MEILLKYAFLHKCSLSFEKNTTFLYNIFYSENHKLLLLFSKCSQISTEMSFLPFVTIATGQHINK